MSTLNAMILATEPSDAYEPTVANILRDQKSGWNTDYYKNDTTTSYDVALARAEAMHQLLIKEAEMHVIQEKLSVREKEKTNSDWQAMNKKDDIEAMKGSIDAIKREISALYLTVRDMEWPTSIQAAADIVHTIRYNRLLEQQRASGLQRLRNTFKEDGNLDYLRRGVTWTETYFARHMGLRPVETSTSACVW